VEVLASVVGLLLLAALILWVIEGVAKLIGSRTAWIVLAGVLPFLIGTAVAIANRDTLVWWQLVAYPFAGPLLVFVLLIAGVLAVNPFAILELICMTVSRLWGKLWSKDATVKRPDKALGFMKQPVRELTREEYQETFSPPMDNVTEGAEEIVDLWGYADQIIEAKYHNCTAWKWRVAHIYESRDGKYQHIGIPVPEDDTYLTVIVDKPARNIIGHYILALAEPGSKARET
jgi:hypothetical protein